MIVQNRERGKNEDFGLSLQDMRICVDKATGDLEITGEGAKYLIASSYGLGEEVDRAYLCTETDLAPMSIAFHVVDDERIVAGEQEDILHYFPVVPTFEELKTLDAMGYADIGRYPEYVEDYVKSASCINGRQAIKVTFN